MKHYRCLWSAQSGRQMVEGSRVVRALGMTQAIAQARDEVAYTLAMPKETVTVTVAMQVEPAATR